MAERRMFAKTIIDSDAFLDMPASTQSLYFHLGMRADDDGFINNPKKISRMVSASDDDLKILIAKKFIIPFENGIVVIKHWRIHNLIQKDRYKETVYIEQKSELIVKDNKSYSIGSKMDTECIQDVSKVEPQVSIGKVSIGKNNIATDKPLPNSNLPAISAMKDETANLYQELLTNVSPIATWGSIPKERKALNELSKRTSLLFNSTDYDSIQKLAHDVVGEFLMQIKTGKNEYWMSCPATPSALMGRWSQVTTLLGKRIQSHANAAEFDPQEIRF